jgi:hypothetical protein
MEQCARDMTIGSGRATVVVLTILQNHNLSMVYFDRFVLMRFRPVRRLKRLQASCRKQRK